MAKAASPFTPDFGRKPPVLAGRARLLSEFSAALAAGPSEESFTSLLLGARGVGKTVALEAARRDAANAGWTVVDADARLPLAGEGSLIARLAARCADVVNSQRKASKRPLTGVTLPVVGGGLSWAHLPPADVPFDDVLDAAVDAASSGEGAGLLVTVDEFHNVAAPEASHLASALQNTTKLRQKPLAFVGAGLPHIAHTLLSHNGFAFFQRCHRRRIGPISLGEARAALEMPLQSAGVECEASLLPQAAAATRGHCYAIQSLGQHLWRLAGAPDNPIKASHLPPALALMNNDMAERVTAPIWNRLSANDKLFLFAMLRDKQASRLADIRKRLANGKSASVYKRRLLDEGAILQTATGRLEFASEALRERASEEQADRTLRRAYHANRTEEEPIDNGEVSPAEPPSVCGAWMPRARKPCVLKEGHKGSHRSKR